MGGTARMEWLTIVQPEAFTYARQLRMRLKGDTCSRRIAPITSAFRCQRPRLVGSASV